MSPEQLSEEKKWTDEEMRTFAGYYYRRENNRPDLSLNDIWKEWLASPLSKAATQPQSAGEEITVRDFEEAMNVDGYNYYRQEKDGLFIFPVEQAAKACYDLAQRMKAATQTGATDWSALRLEFFKEHTVGVGVKKVVTAPYDLFSWFKSKLPTAPESAKPEAPIEIDWQKIKDQFYLDHSITDDHDYLTERKAYQVLQWFIDTIDKSRPELTQGQTGEGMKWVRASERLPSNYDKLYICRYCSKKLTDVFHWSIQTIREYVDAAYEIEWLDESPKSIHDSKTD